MALNATSSVMYPNPTEAFGYPASSQIPACDNQWNHVPYTTLEWQALVSVIKVIFCGVQRLGVAKSIESLARSLSKLTLSEEQSEIPCSSTISEAFACVPVNTGLNVTADCLYRSPVVYDVYVAASGSLDKNWYRECIQSQSKNCLIRCLECYNASDLTRFKFTNFSFGDFTIRIPGRRWTITVIAPEDIYMTKANAIFFAISDFLDTCEAKELLLKKNLTIGFCVVGGVVGALALGGLLGSCFKRCKKQREESSQQLTG